ncbi:DNA gyrase inhibitor YacG [Paracidovorax konjaci]|uniref:DNA gyrase inhibitor YacG n=1 Tax=Paracidovorax konjaci TaxID=32040 RepID=A0A1I1SPW7_9BURK|nr:DNA gyrase inhibitor YacG [Paracidovorax konjaci]SFD48372.1 hypothetical protein SAMN04489710_102368 [Paracidovorax konjaci]
MPPSQDDDPRQEGAAAPHRALWVDCPTCGGKSLYAPANPYRPFCSDRCQQIDFGAWASEDFRMPAEAPPDEDGFGDHLQPPPREH